LTSVCVLLTSWASLRERTKRENPFDTITYSGAWVAGAFAVCLGEVALTKKEMVRQIAAELDVDQVLTKKIVQRTLDTILEGLARSGRVELRNFGVFEVKKRAARKARNPKTNEEVLVPARKVILFQPGKNVAARIAHSGAPAR
jgi:integration host factor subunit beta